MQPHWVNVVLCSIHSLRRLAGAKEQRSQRSGPQPSFALHGVHGFREGPVGSSDFFWVLPTPDKILEDHVPSKGALRLLVGGSSSTMLLALPYAEVLTLKWQADGALWRCM